MTSARVSNRFEAKQRCLKARGRKKKGRKTQQKSVPVDEGGYGTAQSKGARQAARHCPRTARSSPASPAPGPPAAPARPGPAEPPQPAALTAVPAPQSPAALTEPPQSLAVPCGPEPGRKEQIRTPAAPHPVPGAPPVTQRRRRAPSRHRPPAPSLARCSGKRSSRTASGAGRREYYELQLPECSATQDA